MHNITPEEFDLAFMYLQVTENFVEKIKVTSEYAEYLKATCHPVYLNTDVGDGILGKFVGIPIVVDDAIESRDYEIEYKENTK